MNEDADRLYGLPLGDFVTERAALTKRLRAEGRRDEAAAVARLPKPTVAAWAANQVLRSQPSDARELFAAGAALAKARGPALREAIERHRRVLALLGAAAHGLLDERGRGLSGATLEKALQTLHAASLDPELRDEARAGRLVREQSFSGLGLLGEATTEAEDAGAGSRRARAEKERAAARKKHDAAVRRAERALASATRRREAAEAEADGLRAAEAAAREALDALRTQGP